MLCPVQPRDVGGADVVGEHLPGTSAPVKQPHPFIAKDTVLHLLEIRSLRVVDGGAARLDRLAQYESEVLFHVEGVDHEKHGLVQFLFNGDPERIENGLPFGRAGRGRVKT